MSRPNWKGNISIGLVTVPVCAFVAVDDPNKGLEMNLLHTTKANGDPCLARIAQPRKCPECDREVGMDEIIKGYKHGDRYVTFTKDELDSIKPESTQVVEVTTFVSNEEVGLMYYDKPYYLSPNGPVARKPFAMLRDALRTGGTIALGKITMYGHDMFVALRAEEKALVMHTIREKSQIRPVTSVADYDDIPETSDPTQLKLMRQLADSMRDGFDPTLHQDSYRNELTRRIEAKIAGQPIVVTDIKPRAATTDINAALEASLAQMKGKKQAKAPIPIAPAAPAVKAKAKTAAAAKAPARARR